MPSFKYLGDAEEGKYTHMNFKNFRSANHLLDRLKYVIQLAIVENQEQISAARAGMHLQPRYNRARLKKHLSIAKHLRLIYDEVRYKGKW